MYLLMLITITLAMAIFKSLWIKLAAWCITLDGYGCALHRSFAVPNLEALSTSLDFI
jgi:hypothetical protein